MSQLFLFLSFIFIVNYSLAEDLVSTDLVNGHHLEIYTEGEKLILEISKEYILKQQAYFHIHKTTNLSKKCPDEENCFIFDDATLRLENIKTNAFDISWTTSNKNLILQDCYNLNRSNMHWYGGPEWFHQVWPIEYLALDDLVNMPQNREFAAISEGYWLNSRGIYIYVHDRVPLFIDQNFQKLGFVCFAAKNQSPYIEREELVLKYTIGVFENPKDAHLNAVQQFLKKPTGHPNNAIIENPIWSTWARYYRDINDSLVLQFAHEIADHGFQGQFEIDDDWETCYGSLSFSAAKFSDIKTTVRKIKQLGFRVSLWTHPFVNLNCKEQSDIGQKQKYFVTNLENSSLTSWWNSGNNEAQYVDFSKPEATNWFNEKLNSLRDDIGIDTFKFDAGETSWAPQPSILQGDQQLSPQKISEEYVRNCASFGDGIEVRTGWRTQDLPVFVRMIDKDSNWGFANGLYTLITTLLQMNMNGYTMVLPDMVGGNGYYDQKPSAELFVRWLQANTFMPTIQFSFVPWGYTNHTEFDVLKISRKFVNLHKKYSGEVVAAMERSIKEGHPVNAPIWWIDPENPYAHRVDTQYLLGEDILVAPVIRPKGTKRDVYLPKGIWIDGNNGDEYQGGQKIVDYPADINTLPYFLRKGSNASKINAL